MNTGCSCSLSF